MTLQDICTLASLPLDELGLARHNNSNKLVQRCREEDCLELYQRIQTAKRFEKCSYVLSFLGEEGTTARFLGCYRVAGKKEIDFTVLPAFLAEAVQPGDVEWVLEPTDILLEYKNRLIIDWGKGTIGWFHKGTTIKPVLALEPLISPLSFQSYERVLLSYDELKTIVNNPKEHNQWKKELSRIYAVYLISDTRTGKHYVGSAYGEEGLWGRWSSYAKTGDGGNVGMERLLLDDPAYAHNYRFSILKVFPLRNDTFEVRDYEELYKRKLLSRHEETGLNKN